MTIENQPQEKNEDKLATYDSVNTGAPMTTPAMIDERLAKVRGSLTEKGGPAKYAPSATQSPTDEAVAESGREKGRTDDRSRPKGARRESSGEEGGSSRSFSPKKERALFLSEPISKVPVPSIRSKAAADDDIEQQLEYLFQDKPLQSIMESADTVAGQEMFEDGTKVTARVVSILKDNAVVELGSREQGVIPLKQFPEEEFPVLGQMIEAVITRYNREEGLFEVSLPLAAAEVGDWSSISRGMVVEAKIVGINKGGLECEVGKLRGFMPMAQIATFRVENAEQFIGERWKCLVNESNPERRNLVLSRRALMEREREEMREKLIAELEVGQTREGTVRKIIDVGAFVDLGGLDGFIHVSAMSWGRIKHPSDVMKEGDRIKVTIQKIDIENNRISLSFKDESLDPWGTINDKFQEKQQARGRVTKIMNFGAFVELMPGLEGLVHISEISYKRVNVVSDALQEGDWVDVVILSIDDQNHKMGLSIKQLTPDPRIEEQEEFRRNKEEDQRKKEDAEAAKEATAEAEREKARKNQPKGPLKGGVTGRGDGEKFGLKW